MGSNTVETINIPAPIPIEILVSIFNNLCLVNPKMFKTMGIKNTKERINITERLVNVRLKNVKMNRIDNPTVG